MTTATETTVSGMRGGKHTRADNQSTRPNRKEVMDDSILTMEGVKTTRGHRRIRRFDNLDFDELGKGKEDRHTLLSENLRSGTLILSAERGAIEKMSSYSSQVITS